MKILAYTLLVVGALIAFFTEQLLLLIFKNESDSYIVVSKIAGFIIAVIGTVMVFNL